MEALATSLITTSNEHNWVNPSLGGTKQPNHFPRPFTSIFFIYIYIHVYQLHALIYCLKFILEVFFKKLKVCILIKMAPSEINSLNFANS